MHLKGRYSEAISASLIPIFYGDVEGKQTTRNIVVEHTWTSSIRIAVTSRFGVDRYYQKGTSKPSIPPNSAYRLF